MRGERDAKEPNKMGEEEKAKSCTAWLRRRHALGYYGVFLRRYFTGEIFSETLFRSYF